MEVLSPDTMQDHVLDAVRLCPLFRALKPEQFPQLVKAAQLIRYADGGTVVKQGEASDSFFVIIDGVADVTVEKGGGAVEIGHVPNPASFGEVGLLLGEPRTATVRARGDILALQFSGKAFEAMFQKIPNFGMGPSAGLAFRLSQVSGGVHLPDYDKKQGLPAPDVLDLLATDFMQRHRVVALRMDTNVLTLGLVDDPTS